MGTFMSIGAKMNCNTINFLLVKTKRISNLMGLSQRIFLQTWWGYKMRDTLEHWKKNNFRRFL